MAAGSGLQFVAFLPLLGGLFTCVTLQAPSLTGHWLYVAFASSTVWCEGSDGIHSWCPVSISLQNRVVLSYLFGVESSSTLLSVAWSSCHTFGASLSHQTCRLSGVFSAASQRGCLMQARAAGLSWIVDGVSQWRSASGSLSLLGRSAARTQASSPHWVSAVSWAPMPAQIVDLCGPE